MKRTLFALVATGLLTSGCGLFDDIATFSFDTDWQTIDVDTAQFGLTASGATLPDVPCDQDPTICDQATAAGFACSGGSIGCAVACSATKSCAVTADVEVPLPIDISRQVRNQTSAGLLSKVTLDSMDFVTDTNSLNFPTPQITIFVGPDSATNSTSAGVEIFGTMAPIPAGTTPSGTVETTANGQAALAEFVRNYTVPFKFFVRAETGFGAGDPLPEGRLTVRVRAGLKADLL